VDIYQIIDGMYPELQKVELFCRGEPVPGWAGWRNECTWKPDDQNDVYPTRPCSSTGSKARQRSASQLPLGIYKVTTLPYNSMLIK
jgi:hypothetical protein